MNPPETRTRPEPVSMPPGESRDGSSRIRVVLVFSALVLMWGSTWYVIRIGLEGYPPFFSLAVRFLVAGPLLLLVMKVRGDPIPWQWPHQPFFISLGLLSFVTSYGVVYWAEQFVPSGLAAVVFALFPIFVGIVGHFLLAREHLGWMRVAGLLIGLGGIAVINSGDLALVNPLAPVAAVVLILSPLVSAIASVLTKRAVHDFPVLAFAALPMTYAAVCHLFLWRLLESGIELAWSWPGVLSILYLAIPGSMLTFAGYFWLLRRMEAGRAALIAYLTPLIALVIGNRVGGEAITFHILVGAGLVLTGVTLANRAQVEA